MSGAACERIPARRFQTMADLKVALEELKEESDQRQPVRAARKRSRAAQTRRLACCVARRHRARLPLLYWLLRPTERTAQTSMIAVPFTSYPGYEMYPSFSPDGNQVAFVWNGERQDNDDIYVKLIGPGSPIRITTDPAEDYDPAWSPDGRWIAFVRSLPDAKAGFFVIPALGGPERKLAETSSSIWYSSLPGPHVAWSTDGKWLIIANKPSPSEPSALFCLSVNTGEMRQLTHPPATRQRQRGCTFSGRPHAGLRPHDCAGCQRYLSAAALRRAGAAGRTGKAHFRGAMDKVPGMDCERAGDRFQPGNLPGHLQSLENCGQARAVRPGRNEWRPSERTASIRPFPAGHPLAWRTPGIRPT